MDLEGDVDGSTSMSSGNLSPDPGKMWRYGCPKSPDWDSDVDLGTEGEESSAGTSSDEKYEERNVRNLSLEVVEGWSGWLVHLFLEDWELARVASSCHLAQIFGVRKCKTLGSHRVAAIFVAHTCSIQTFLPSWKGCDSVERKVVEEPQVVSLREEVSEEDFFQKKKKKRAEVIVL